AASKRPGPGASASSGAETDTPSPYPTGEGVSVERVRSGLSAEDRLLDLCDGFGDLDAARAGLGAVEGRAAAPHALFVVEDVESDVGVVIARIEDEAVRVHDRGGTEVLSVGP